MPIKIPLKAMPFDPGRVYLEHEVAEVLQVKRQTMATWRHNLKGPPFAKLGRWVRYTGADLNAWLRSNIVATTS